MASRRLLVLCVVVGFVSLAPTSPTRLRPGVMAEPPWLSGRGSMGIAAVVSADSEQTRNPRTSPADVAAGAKTFRSHCSPCHGLKGEGGRGPNLTTGAFFQGSSDLELLNNISDGIPGTEMPGLFYSPDRVWQVVSYIRSLNAGNRSQSRVEVSRGAELFHEKGCPQCHRVNGQGGRLGPDLSDIGRSRAPEHLRQALIDPNADVRQRYWVVSYTGESGKREEGFLLNEDSYTVQFMDMNERLHSLNKAGLKHYKVEKISKMPSFKDSLNSNELEQLLAYLASLRPKGGTR